jgi:hypothetical protein
VDVPFVPNSVVVEIERPGFENVFLAAEKWNAALHSGVPYSDPGSFQVFFCRPSDYAALAGRYESKDAVWFEFPPSFRDRLFERIQAFSLENHLSASPTVASVGFTTEGPDFFAVRKVERLRRGQGVCS